MFVARTGFGTFSKAALALWLTVLLLSTSALLSAQTVNITEYPVSNATGALGIATGSDGALWFTESASNRIGRITVTGAITEFFPPSNCNPGKITAGPDGALWFAETNCNKIGRITTAGTITEYVLPSQLPFNPDGITVGPDGALWFTEITNSGSGKIGRITTAGAITEYTLPNPSINTVSTGITTGPDGALWFTETTTSGGKIGRITTSGSITEYPVPTSPAQFLQDITTGPDGALWFTELEAWKIGRITTTGTITEYTLSGPIGLGGPWGITLGSDGALWFTESYGQTPTGTGKVGRITTAGTISEYALSSAATGGEITLGPDGALWFAEWTNSASKIGRVQLPPNRSGVLSHIAAGGGWTTVITLVNTSPVPVPVTVALHNDDGTALTLPVTTTQQGISQTTSTASVTATINPKATLLISTGDQVASTVVGWADVTSAGLVNGFAIFRTASSNSPVSEGTVPLQTQSPSTITLPYDNSAGFVMGVALANLSTAPANITATIWDDSGNQLGTQNLTIAGNGHTSFVLPTQIPLTAGKRGIVQFQGSGGIAGLGLRFSPFGTFTSVPTM